MNRLRLSLTGFFGPNEHYLVAEQHVGIKIIYSVDPRVSTPIFLRTIAQNQIGH